MPTLNYYDALLKSNVTNERENRAIDEVAAIGDFGSVWNERLTILRAYIITALECQAQPDDVFAQKAKQYRDEFKTALSQAVSSTTDAATGKPASVFSVSLERA